MLVFRDITEKQQAEDQVRQAAEANAKFRTVFEQGAQFAGILSLDGTVVEANRQCLDACGFARADVIGKPFWECGWWNRSPALMGTVRAAALGAAAGMLFRAESNYFVADGRERFVDLTISPVTGESGRVLFVAATGVDVTDRKRAEEALRAADRKKDDFLALLAHELRNPLAPIRNGLQVIRLSDDRAARERSQAMMDRQLGAHGAADRRPARRVPDQPEQDGAAAGAGRAGRRGGQRRRDRPPGDRRGRARADASRCPREPVYLDADLTRLAQVFSNLLTNSAKYTAAGRPDLAHRRAATAARWW